MIITALCVRGGGGRAWQGGGVHGRGGMYGRGMCSKGRACGGMRGGGCVGWHIPRDTVNERAVHILLECILVLVLNEKKIF